MTIELHLSPGKSTPRAHLVVNRMSVSPNVNSSTAVLPFDCKSFNFSWVIRLSSFRVWFSFSVGRSLNAEMWTRVGCFDFAMHMSRIFRYWFLVIVPSLKLLKEQFFSSPVRCLLIVPGFWVSASMILKSFSPKISLRTCSEWRVPDIMTRTLFCSMSSLSFWARLMETREMKVACCLLLVACWSNNPFWVVLVFSIEM